MVKDGRGVRRGRVRYGAERGWEGEGTGKEKGRKGRGTEMKGEKKCYEICGRSLTSLDRRYPLTREPNELDQFRQKKICVNHQPLKSDEAMSNDDEIEIVCFFDRMAICSYHPKKTPRAVRTKVIACLKIAKEFTRHPGVLVSVRFRSHVRYIG